MNRKIISVLAIALTASTFAWADEPASPKGSVRQQRVSPKLLREALNIPETHLKATEAQPAAPTLDDLQKLADRLRKSGNADDADLLQHFIREHQNLSKATAPPALQSTTTHPRIDVELKIVDVDFDNLATDSPLHNPNLTATPDEIRVELDRLVAEKSAKTLTETVRNIKVNKVVRNTQGEAVPIPMTGEKGLVTTEFRELGTCIEFQATPNSTGRIRLQMCCEISPKSADSSVTGQGIPIPGELKRKINVALESPFGEWSVPTQFRGEKGHKLFVMAKVTPSN